MQILEGDLLRKMNSSRKKKRTRAGRKNASRKKREIKGRKKEREQEEKENASRKKYGPRCLPYASIQSHLRA